MNTKTTRLHARNNNAGATAVMVAISMIMLLGFSALAIDVGYLFATRNELQNIADAGALAGAGFLGAQYGQLTIAEQQGFLFDRADIVNAINQVSQKNEAARMPITIADSDVVIGTWDGDTAALTPTLSAPDAVRVVARRDNTVNTPIRTLFARIFGIETVNVGAVATAALTGPSTIAEGELQTPFSLSDNWFNPNTQCDQVVNFSPTTDSCAGWHNFFDAANANSMNEKMLGLIRGNGDGTENNPCLLAPCGQDWLNTHFDLNQIPDTLLTPETSIGDSYDHQGGNIASLFSDGVLDNYDGAYTSTVLGNDGNPAPFPALFDYFRYRDGDNDDSVWSTTVVVYEGEEVCSNPTGPMQISGFARIIITMPNPPPDTSVSVLIDCRQIVVQGRGGGGNNGNIRGTIPNIVQ